MKDPFAKPSSIWPIVALVVVVAIVLGAFGIFVSKKASGDKVTGRIVFLFDLTDTLSPITKGAIREKFRQVLLEAPAGSSVELYAVSHIQERLLEPITPKPVKNPMSFKADGQKSIDEKYGITSNTKMLEKKRESQFEKPLLGYLEKAFLSPDAPTSPIIESIQSVVISSLQDAKLIASIENPDQENHWAGRHLVVVSDFMQNTPEISFYKGLLTPDQVMSSRYMQSKVLDMRGIKVHPWIVSRESQETRLKLQHLWTELFSRWNGDVCDLDQISN